MMTQGTQKRIFVSYARQDAGAIASISQTIEGLGQELWFDRQLSGGQQWWDVILERIRGCDAFLFLLSPNSAKSKACRHELQYAIANERPLLPIMVSTVDTRLFPEGLANFQYVDYREATIPSTVALVSALTRLPPAGPLKESLPTSPPVPITYLDDFTIRLEAESLSLREQKALAAELADYLDDEDDRPAASELLRTLRRRPDVIESVGRDIDRLIADTAEPPADPAPEVAPRAEPVPAVPAPAPAAAVRDSGFHNPPGFQNENQPRTYRFVAPNVDVWEIAGRLENWLTSERLETQTLREGSRVTVQARSAEAWKRWTGAGVAFTVAMQAEGSDLLVQIGQAEWKDKAAAAAFGLLIAWPVLIPAMFGAAKQKQLPEKALRLIEQSVIARPATPQV